MNTADGTLRDLRPDNIHFAFCNGDANDIDTIAAIRAYGDETQPLSRSNGDDLDERWLR